jgi:hypothetical protein
VLFPDINSQISLIVSERRREEKKRRLDGVNGLLSVIGRFAGRRVLLFFCEVPVFLALAARSLGANQ